MTHKSFSKILSANDTGETGGHQGGILIPKGEKELLAFLPALDPAVKNPDAWIRCLDENGEERRLRFVYYNNRLHDAKGTRNEYRLTHMTEYLRGMRATQGDGLEISRKDGADVYSIRVVRAQPAVAQVEDGPVRIKITSSWRRIH